MNSIPTRFWNKVDFSGECWNWTASTDTKGYGKFGIMKHKLVQSHRMAWRLSRGPIPEGQFVLHRCDNRRCVRPAHLYLGTQFDNMRDCAVRGRNWTKITKEQAISARTDPRPVKVIAGELGISTRMVYNIKKGLWWRHV